MFHIAKKIFLFDLTPSLLHSSQNRIQRDFFHFLQFQKQYKSTDMAILSSLNIDITKQKLMDSYPFFHYVFFENGNHCCVPLQHTCYQNTLISHKDYPIYVDFIDEINHFCKNKIKNYNSFEHISIGQSMINVRIQSPSLQYNLYKHIDFRKKMYPFKEPVGIHSYPELLTIQPQSWNSNQVISFLKNKNYHQIFYFGNKIKPHPSFHLYPTISPFHTFEIIKNI